MSGATTAAAEDARLSGRWLREERERLGRSRREAARAAGIGATTAARIEGEGVGDVRLSKVANYLAALGLRPEALERFKVRALD